MRIVCLSDTHSAHDKIDVPDGDLLIHAGDFTGHGSKQQVEAFDEWIGNLPHRYKIVIAGNHDFLFEDEPDIAVPLLKNCIYLQDKGITLEGIKIWGSPWQPVFKNWAFNLEEKDLATKWAMIPKSTNLLITHGPPFSILDKTIDYRNVGCKKLLEAVQRIKPQLHVFGHIHESYGKKAIAGTIFVNASICTLSYRPSQLPIVVDLDV